MGWQDVEKVKPKQTGYYNVVCEIGSMLGCFRTVRTYRYEIKNSQLSRTEKWCIPNDITEIVTITHWQALPFLPHDPNWEEDNQ